MARLLGRRGAGAGLAVAVVLAAAGCGSSGATSGGGGDDTLRAELAKVTDTANHRALVDFGDLAAQRKAGLTATRMPGSVLAGHGWGSLASSAILTEKSFGFDGRKADTAIEAGQPPELGGRLDGGVDPAAVSPRLTALGGVPAKSGSSGKTWRLAPDHQVPVTGKLSTALDGTPAFNMNVVRTGGSSLLHGTSLAAVDGLDADGGATLAGNGAFAAVAGCLDGPLAAELTDHGEGFARNARTAAPSATAVLGVGVRGTSASSLSQVLCRANPSEAAAKALAARLRSRLATGTAPSAREPWRDLLSGTTVTLVGGDHHIVRLTAHAGRNAPPDILFRTLTNGDLTSLLSP